MIRLGLTTLNEKPNNLKPQTAKAGHPNLEFIALWGFSFRAAGQRQMDAGGADAMPLPRQGMPPYKLQRTDKLTPLTRTADGGALGRIARNGRPLPGGDIGVQSLTHNASPLSSSGGKPAGEDLTLSSPSLYAPRE